MKQTTSQLLEHNFRAAFRRADIPDTFPIALVASSKPMFGDYQVNGVMAAAKNLDINPRDLASRIVSHISIDEVIAKLEVAGPGFINITLANGYLSSILNADHLLSTPPRNPLTVVVDYSSPNLAKEMHVGHLRSTIIGDVLVRLHEFLGDRVIRRNHVGDWGTQFGMLLAYLEELQHDRRELLWELKNLEDFYRGAKLRFDDDPLFANRARAYVTKLQAEDPEIIELWRQFVQISMSHCQEVYERLQVKLVPADAVGESFYNNLLPTMVETLMQCGVAVNNDGAKCVFFTPGELTTESTAPFIIQKQDGGYLYATTDIAAAYERVHHLHADLLLYVIDSRQSLHLQQLFATVKKAHLVQPTTVMEHIAFGTMLDQNNRPFKTRSGDTVKLTTLIDTAVAKAMEIISQRHPDWEYHRKEILAEILAVAAIKYADLSKNRLSDYVFNLDQMLALDGNTAPYLLYAYVRIYSLFGKYNGLSPMEYQCGKITISNTKERNLALHLSKFTDVILQSTIESYPHYLCNYAYELAVAFMHFYESCPIMQEDTAVRESRLSLASLVALVLKTVFDLLGIPATDRM